MGIVSAPHGLDMDWMLDGGLELVEASLQLP